MRWSQVFSYVFPSFASLYALDSAHSDGIVSAQNFQCVGCKINLFDLFFSKSPFCSPRGRYTVRPIAAKGNFRIVQPGALTLAMLHEWVKTKIQFGTDVRDW